MPLACWFGPGAAVACGLRAVSAPESPSGNEWWLRSLTIALAELSDAGLRDDAPVAPLRLSKAPRTVWFRAATVCGLAVTLLPLGAGQLGDHPAEPSVQSGDATAVRGWRYARPSATVWFDEQHTFAYRGMIAPLLAVAPAADHIAAVDGSGSAAVRIGFGARLAAGAEVRRFVVKNVPASAILSRGHRTDDGAWIIDASTLADVVIAVVDPLPPNHSIWIEGQTQGGVQLSRFQLRFDAGPLVSPVARQPVPNVASPVSSGKSPAPDEPVAAATLPRDRPHADVIAERARVAPLPADVPAARTTPLAAPKAARERPAPPVVTKRPATVPDADRWRADIFFSVGRN